MNNIHTNLKDIINTLHNLTNKKKVAIGFFGITRSLKYTIDSIKINIFNVLKEQNIDYDIYLHTYRINEPFTNPRSKEVNIRLNFNEYKLLEPKYFIFDELKKTKLELLQPKRVQ